MRSIHAAMKAKHSTECIGNPTALLDKELLDQNDVQDFINTYMWTCHLQQCPLKDLNVPHSHGSELHNQGTYGKPSTLLLL